MTKYLELLDRFGVYTLSDDIMEAYNNRGITIDCIHDAIIAIGVDMTEPISHYIVKARCLAINNINIEKRRGEILVENNNVMKTYSQFSGSIEEYGFVDIEIEYLYKREVLGLPDSKTGLPRRTIALLKKNIYKKLYLADK